MSEAAKQGGLRVVKLGGSLLDWPEFPGQLRSWLSQQSPACNVLIAGGGGFADVIRAADQTHSLGELVAHKLCIDALQVTARMVACLLPEARGPLPPSAMEPSAQAQTLLLDVAALIDLDTQRSVRPLPASWDVTTDSIAARAAVLLNADELVLLKSTLPQRAASLRNLADAGYVDAHFPVCAKSLSRIRLVNLRASDYAEVSCSMSPSHR